MADGRPTCIVVAITIVLCLAGQCLGAQQYLGKFLGKLSELHHGVSGEVYAVDARTLHVKDFTYDGEGPAAYFWAGNSRTPSSSGFRVRDENGSGSVLKRYRKKSVTLTLPEGKNLNNIKWFSVWCDEFAVNFGDVKIPRNFDYPKPQKIDPLRGVHGISSDNVVIVDAQTLLVPNLSYDGEAPDAKFWVGRGSKPSPQGIRVPDENGKEVPLRRYDRKTVVLTLPGDVTVFDIGHFGIWCEAFTVDFGHIRIPQNLNVPPSLKMLGVSPQSKLNCEVLLDELAFEVRWAVAGDSIVLQLVAKLDNGEYMSFGLSGDIGRNRMIGGDVAVAWVNHTTLKGSAEDYYLQAKAQCSGPQGACPDEHFRENTNSLRPLNAAMVNGYSIVTYQRPLRASDEFDLEILTNQSQAIIWAIGPLNELNQVSFHSHYTKKDHFIDFGRPARWNCPMPESDSSSTPPAQTSAPPLHRTRQPVTEKEQEVSNPVEITTRGRVSTRRRGGNPEQTNQRRRDGNHQTSERGGSYRTEDEPRTTTASRRRGVNRQTERTVTTSTTERHRTVPTPKPVANRNAWHIPAIQCYEPDDGVFYAQMGPTGGKRGYPAITGHVGWGISWYINGLLIPEINVVRGKTYTFVVEGGLDPEVPAKYHPFYITDDPIGGYEHKTQEEKQSVRIFAGAKQTRDGHVYPTGVGRLCHWTHTGDLEADEFQSFGAFQRTLELRCDEGEPGVITWTPDANTPDTVYYQCFTHRYLGWKINVLDACDARPEASGPEPVVALPDAATHNGDLKSSPSIIVETRIKPNDLFQTTHTKQLSDRPASPDTYSYQPPPPEPDIITLESATATSARTTPTRTTPADNSNTASRRPQKPIFTRNKAAIRRPHPHSHNRPVPMKHRTPAHRPIIYQIQSKKSFYRIPMRKRPVPRPALPIQQKSTIALPNQEPILIMRTQQILLKPTQINRPKTNSTSATSTTSPEQISTTGLPVASQLSTRLNYHNQISTMRPAVNTGFRPESIVIEGGFRPIINKEFEKRMSEINSEEDEDIGVIKLHSDNTENTQQLTESFEPMFIPSPPDSLLLLTKKQNFTKFLKRRSSFKKNPSFLVIVKHVARSVNPDEQPNDDEDNDDDEIAMAAEQIESYYLPPDSEKSRPAENIQKHSNIDIPAGAVVTYDGKTVSGASLTAPITQPGQLKASATKTSALLRVSPQYGPFKGEIPPLNTQNINVANLPQLRSQGVINRDLNAPAAAPGPSAASHTTKLAPIRTNIRTGSVRSKRNARHTVEHVAEQKMRAHQTLQDEHHGNGGLSSITCLPIHSLLFLCVISFIINYI